MATAAVTTQHMPRWRSLTLKVYQIWYGIGIVIAFQKDAIGCMIELSMGLVAPYNLTSVIMSMLITERAAGFLLNVLIIGVNPHGVQHRANAPALVAIMHR